MTQSYDITSHEANSVLARDIRTAHAAACHAARTALDQARVCGDLLLTAKAAVPHGQWLPWLQQHVDFSARTAAGYMTIARRWEALEDRRRVADLPVREALKLLAEPTAPRHPEPIAITVPADSSMMGSVQVNGEHWCAFIDPHTDADFLFVNVITVPVTTDDAFADLAAIVEDADAVDRVEVTGGKRAIRRDHVGHMLAVLGFPDGPVEWTTEPSGESWTHNRMMFASHQQYINEAILGVPANTPTRIGR